jgi:hypothetical protein
MKHQRQRKCLCCCELFQADPRNLRHQQYCSKAACRKVSKAASQRRWLAKAENRDYFRGPENVARVQAWRKAHPGYRQRGATQGAALQENCHAQAIETKAESEHWVATALQDDWVSQPAVLIGLIAHITDSALQDDIARSTRRLLQLGQDILSGRAGDGYQTSDLRRSGSPGARPV